MVLNKKTGYEFIIYLNKCDLDEVDTSNYPELKRRLTKIFKGIKKNGLINPGFYEVEAYINKDYGVILEVKREYEDYLELLKGDIDLRVLVNYNQIFLYKTNDAQIINRDKTNVYYYDEGVYLELMNNLTRKEWGILLENSIIIYGDVTNDIKQYGKLII